MTISRVKFPWPPFFRIFIFFDAVFNFVCGTTTLGCRFTAACKVWRVAQEPPCGTQSEVKELVSTPLALPMHCTPAFSCALRGRFPDIQC